MFITSDEEVFNYFYYRGIIFTTLCKFNERYMKDLCEGIINGFKSCQFNWEKPNWCFIEKSGYKCKLVFNKSAYLPKGQVIYFKEDLYSNIGLMPKKIKEEKCN